MIVTIKQSYGHDLASFLHTKTQNVYLWVKFKQSNSCSNLLRYFPFGISLPFTLVTYLLIRAKLKEDSYVRHAFQFLH